MAPGRGVQALEDGHVGGEHVPRVLGTAPGRGEERAFQVKAGDGAVVGQAGQHDGPGFQFGQRRGDQAGQHARAAAGTVERRGRPGVVLRALGERGAAATVGVHVDEPGENPLAAQIDGGLLRGVAGPDRVDQRPGQPDPPGAEHAAWRYYPAARQQEH